MTASNARICTKQECLAPDNDVWERGLGTASGSKGPATCSKIFTCKRPTPNTIVWHRSTSGYFAMPYASYGSPFMASCARFATLVTAASSEVMQHIHICAARAPAPLTERPPTLTLHLRFDFAPEAHFRAPNGPQVQSQPASLNPTRPSGWFMLLFEQHIVKYVHLSHEIILTWFQCDITM